MDIPSLEEYVAESLKCAVALRRHCKHEGGEFLVLVEIPQRLWSKDEF